MPAILPQLKEKAQEAFTQLAAPTFSHAKGFGLNVALDFEKIYSQIKPLEKISINADPAVKICRLSELEQNFVQKYAQDLVSPTENKLIALHYQTTQDATVIIIAKNSKIASPIIINTFASEIASAESIIVIAEEGAEAIMVEDVTSASDAYYKSQVVQIFAAAKAKITYCTLHAGNQSLNSLVTKRGQALQDAVISWFDVVLGNAFTQVQLRSCLQESGAEAQQYQAIAANKTQQADIVSDIVHQHKNTHSRMIARAICEEQARAMYKGVIKIEKGASDCRGHQRSDILLVGEEARGHALPVLEVENDDVSCSHAATMGQIDEEQLYYLLSRGLDEAKAKGLLLQAFLEPVLQKIPDEETREKIAEQLKRHIQHGN